MSLPVDLLVIAPHLASFAAATGFSVAGRKAVDRLLCGGADYLLSPLDDLNQSKKDIRDQKSIVSRAIAEAAAKEMVADRAFVERALFTTVNEAVRKQKAREKVGILAAENLLKTPVLEGPVATNVDSEIDEDWMNIFVGYAERSSHETLQALWAKILAGEVRRQGSFSLSAMRIMAEMNSEGAAAFGRLSAFSAGAHVFLPAGHTVSQDLSRCIALGLASHTIGFEPQADGRQAVVGDRYALAVEDEKSIFEMAHSLTPAGRELKVLLQDIDEEANLRRVGVAVRERHPNARITLLQLGPDATFESGRALEEI